MLDGKVQNAVPVHKTGTKASTSQLPSFQNSFKTCKQTHANLGIGVAINLCVAGCTHLKRIRLKVVLKVKLGVPWCFNESILETYIGTPL